DATVTGVQTCALPISSSHLAGATGLAGGLIATASLFSAAAAAGRRDAAERRPLPAHHRCVRAQVVSGNQRRRRRHLRLRWRWSRSEERRVGQALTPPP